MQRLTKSDFLAAYPDVRKVVSDYFAKQLPTCPERATDWVKQVFDYNVTNGKLTRGLTVVHAFQCLKPAASARDLKMAVTLGWIGEILHACSLVADDIMDSSSTRRGRACWYKVPNVGMNAIYDAFLLENSAHILLKHSFTDEKLRNSISNIIDEAKLTALLGQHLDMESVLLNECTKERYSNIVRQKTGHCSFYSPIVLALILAGENIENASNELQQLCYDMGYYFQVQDDFLDCFGDPVVTRKEGTDIQEGKCTWLLIEALDSIEPNDNDYKTLESNYGKSERSHVDAVKTLYTRLGLERKYAEFESKIFKRLKNQIDDLTILSLRELFVDLLHELHHRKK